MQCRAQEKSVTASIISAVKSSMGYMEIGVFVWNANRFWKFSGLKRGFSPPFCVFISFWRFVGIFSPQEIVVDHIKSVIHLFYYSSFLSASLSPSYVQFSWLLFFFGAFVFIQILWGRSFVVPRICNKKILHSNT